MEQRIQSIDVIRTIDRILQSNKSTVSFTEDRYVDPIKPVQEVEQDVVHNEPSREQLNSWVEQATAVLQRRNASLSFRVHEGTGRTLVELVDGKSEEVLREIPPEKILDIIAGIWEWSGLVIDEMG
jgi:flagellar protein FlaG